MDKKIFDVKSTILGCLIGVSIAMIELPFIFHFKIYGYAESAMAGSLLFIIMWIYFFIVKKYKLIERGKKDGNTK